MGHYNIFMDYGALSKYVAFFFSSNLQIQDVQSPKSVSYSSHDKCVAIDFLTPYFRNARSIASLTTHADI